mgnify:CR=1 FL=1
MSEARTTNQQEANMAQLIKESNGTYSIKGIQLTEGHVSSTGKSMVLFSERIKDGDKVAQVNVYTPNKQR